MNFFNNNKKLIMTLAVLAVATIGVFGLAGSAQAARKCAAYYVNNG